MKKLFAFFLVLLLLLNLAVSAFAEDSETVFDPTTSQEGADPSDNDDIMPIADTVQMVHDDSTGLGGGWWTLHILSYQSYVDGQWRSRNIQAITRKYLNGKLAYCLEPAVDAGMSYAQQTDAWENLPQALRYAIALVLAYGYPANTELPDGPNDPLDAGHRETEKYFATQLLIWEFLTGVRSYTAPYDLTGEKPSYRNVVGDGTANFTTVPYAYDAILAGIKSHNEIPAFAAKLQSNAPVYTLTYNASSGIYTCTLPAEKQSTLRGCNFKLDSGIYFLYAADKQTVTGFQATAEAALKLGGGKTFQAQSPYRDASESAVVTWGAAGETQPVATYNASPDPSMAYFTLTAEARGSLEIVKESSDGNIADISFKVEEYVPGIGYCNVGTYTTDSGGKITIPADRLTVGWKYKITENVPPNYEPQEPQEITLKPGVNTVTFVNRLATRDLEIIKTSPDGKVDGIEFTVKDSGGAVVGTGKTDDSGKLTIPGLRIGATYTVTETVPDGYLCTKNPQTVTIAEGTNTVTFENRPIFGNIELTKVDEEYPENKLTGAEFTVTIQKDGTTSTQKMAEDKDASGKGTGVYRLEHIAYGSVCTIRETAAPVGFVLSSETFTVTILEEKTYTVSSANFDAVVNRPIEGSLKLVKIDRSGETPLEGAGFRVFDSSGKKVAEGYTDQNGALEFKDLRYGNYTYQEFAAPDGFLLDDTVYDFSILRDGQTVSVTRENDAIAGSIRIYKVNAEGQPLSGVSFLLEYSTDGGKTYQPVFFRDETASVTTGGCTSAGLNDGVLITGEDGVAIFTGLRIDTQTGKIRYRLTETKTQDSYQLLTGSAFEGELPADEEIDVELTVVNNHSYELPATGGSGFPFVTLGLALTGLAALTLVVTLRKKKQGE